MVTTGPGRTSTMSPRTWKSSSTLSSRRALRSSPARSICVLALLRRRRRAGRASAADNCRRARGSAWRASWPCALARRGWRGGDRPAPARRRRPPGATAAGRRRSPGPRAASSSGAARRRRRSASRRNSPADPALLFGPQAEREIAERQAGEREQHQQRQPQRPCDRRIADQADRRSRRRAPRRGRARRPSRREGRTPPSRCVRPSAMPSSTAPIAATSSAAADPARRLEPRIIRRPASATTGRNSADAEPEQEQQRVAGIGAEAARASWSAGRRRRC